MDDDGNDSKEQIVDVRSVVEAVAADDSSDAPLYQVESLCMRCGENVLPLSLSLSLTLWFGKLKVVFHCLIVGFCWAGHNQVFVDSDSTLQEGM